jgi:hypothetical protein
MRIGTQFHVGSQTQRWLRRSNSSLLNKSGRDSYYIVGRIAVAAETVAKFAMLMAAMETTEVAATKMTAGSPFRPMSAPGGSGCVSAKEGFGFLDPKRSWRSKRSKPMSSRHRMREPSPNLQKFAAPTAGTDESHALRCKPRSYLLRQLPIT